MTMIKKPCDEKCSTVEHISTTKTSPSHETDPEEIFKTTLELYANSPAVKFCAGIKGWSFNKRVAWYTYAFLKVAVPLAMVITLGVFYGFRISVIRIDIFSVGVYGLLLLIDFAVQTIFAICNRIANSRDGRKVSEDPERDPDGCANVSTVCVGYREDEVAWGQCLESIARLELGQRCINTLLAIVDGKEEEDRTMSATFERVFPKNLEKPSSITITLDRTFIEDHWDKYNGYLCEKMPQPLGKFQKFSNWITGRTPILVKEAQAYAWSHVRCRARSLVEELNLSSYQRICVLQPHGGKRDAMFTGFALAVGGLRNQDYILNMDSDTMIDKYALLHMERILQLHPKVGAVGGDVKISNRKDSIIAFLCSLRYWFAFNIERGCQSYFRCVTCIPGPLGLYKISALETVASQWATQTFFNTRTTFGDDRHMTNCILAAGYQTKLTYLAFCETETPTTALRWIKQQTRWSRSFWRESIMFPQVFILHNPWMLIETSKATLYPFIIMANVIRFLYSPNVPELEPLFWILTLIGVGFVRSLTAVVITREIKFVFFTLYGLMYFFGLLPCKAFALVTMAVKTWGTSARSGSEIRKCDTWSQRCFHSLHAVLWIAVVSGGVVTYLKTKRHVSWLVALVLIVVLVAFLALFRDLLVYQAKQAWGILRRRRTPAETVEGGGTATSTASLGERATSTASSGASATFTVLSGETATSTILSGETAAQEQEH